MPLGLSAALRSDPERYPGEVRLATVVGEAGELRGALVQTGSHSPSISAMPDDVATFAGRCSAEAWPDIRGVFGTDSAAAAFAHAAAPAVGDPSRIVAMGLWALHRVEQVPRAAGDWRPTTGADAALHQGWLEAFAAEAVPHDPHPPATAGERLARAGRAYLWCDREPVADGRRGLAGGRDGHDEPVAVNGAAPAPQGDDDRGVCSPA